MDQVQAGGQEEGGGGDHIVILKVCFHLFLSYLTLGSQQGEQGRKWESGIVRSEFRGDPRDPPPHIDPIL